MNPAPLLAVIFVLFLPIHQYAQDSPVSPSIIISGEYLGTTPPLSELPVLSDTEWMVLFDKAERKLLNPKLQSRSYPYAETSLPQGPDPAWQRHMGTNPGSRAPLLNFSGQDSPYYPPDATGAAGPDHYMQTINTVYSIYDKEGTLVAGPTALNTLFEGVPGSECNNGDPVVLFDEQAGRWFVAEFSICGANDYVLIAVSTTDDPTGTWYKYSFDVDDVPDFEKFGVWQDGYYMGTNNATGNDIYVFERSAMLIGDTAQAVGFNNPWRPTTSDGFMCVPPLDNDGSFAPEGEPGLFITINDDAIGGGSDQLWIYELDVNWVTPASSTFTRAQQIAVNAFDSNFGANWENIAQPGTSRKLDAIPQVIMNPPQYRNFGSYQTIVCCHTVDVDNSDHAGIRWYELRKACSGSWTVRQQGTYAPDEHSRWLGSIMLNGQNQIGLGYAISSSALFPGIRYCGQSSAAYASASGVLDIAEEVIVTGAYSQINTNRWGDYVSLQVDPADDTTFWFTAQYVGPSSSRKTKIASFNLGPVLLEANFFASSTTPSPDSIVTFNDLSTGEIVDWLWDFSPDSVTFHEGTGISSQNPLVSFNTTGYYSVSLTVSSGLAENTETRTDYIQSYTPGLWTGMTSVDWNIASNWDGSLIPDGSITIVLPDDAVNWPVFSGNFIVGSNCKNITFGHNSEMNITGNFIINQGRSVDMTAGGSLRIGGNWINNGSFTAGSGTVILDGSGQLAISSTLIPSDITCYSVTPFTKGMITLTNATPGPAGDDKWNNASIGFTFKYAGTNYSTLRISTNGWLSLNQTGNQGYNNTFLFTSSVPNATITAWWDNLYDDLVSTVQYKTAGSAPNRVFTAEWLRVRSYEDNATARISFQVKLYETSNSIEFHYGPVEDGIHDEEESASIGIEDNIGGPGHFIDATTGSSTTGISSLVSSEDWPTVNYRFAPADLTQRFYNLIINNTNGTVNFTVDTEVSGNLQILPGGSFIINSGKTLRVKGSLP
jgi:PKD repeat protein